MNWPTHCEWVGCWWLPWGPWDARCFRCGLVRNRVGPMVEYWRFR